MRPVVSISLRPQRAPQRAQHDRPDDGNQRQQADDAEPDVDALDEPLSAPPTLVRRRSCARYTTQPTHLVHTFIVPPP